MADDELDGVIAAYLNAEDAGRAPAPAAVLAAHPHLAGPLGAFLADHLGLAGLLRPPPPANGLFARGDAFAGFEVLAEAGFGGAAVVYRARQPHPAREVALKILHPSAGDPEAAERFRFEAASAGGIAHPNVARLFASGEWEGRRYLVSEWLPGGTLAGRLAEFVADPPAAARVVRDIARGVAAAHAAGVLHRDLKPANVLFDAAGVPKLADFGCATAVGRLTRLTRRGEAVGTLEYMAPEQASPRLGPPTTRTDVHGLGAVLYAALTGRAPFAADGPAEVLAAAVGGSPPGVRGLNPLVGADLAAVCGKCLEKSPARRYRSADEVADDLDRTLRGEPVSARAPGPARWAWASARRHPAVTALSAALGLALLASLVTFAGLWRRAEAAQAKADRRLALASDALVGFKDSAEARSLLPDDRAREDRATLVKLAGWLTRCHDDFPGDLAERHRAAYGLLQVAKMLGRLHEDALAAGYADEALGYLRAVVVADPANARHRSSLSEACVQRVSHRTALGRHEGNLESLREAVALAAGLAADFPASDHYRGTHASFNTALGAEYVRLGRPGEAVGPLHLSVRDAAALVEKYGDVDPWRHVYYDSALQGLAEALHASGRGPAEYLAAREAAVAYLDAHSARRPAEARLVLPAPAVRRVALAAALDNTGRRGEADAVMAHAEDESAAEVAQASDSLTTLLARASFLRERAFRLMPQDRPAALECFAQAGRLEARAAQAAGGVASRNAAQRLHLAGLLLRTAPELRDAAGAVALLEESARAGDLHPPDRLSLARAYAEAGRHHDAAREFATVGGELATTHRRSYPELLARAVTQFRVGDPAARAEFRRVSEAMHADYTTDWEAWQLLREAGAVFEAVGVSPTVVPAPRR